MLSFLGFSTSDTHDPSGMGKALEGLYLAFVEILSSILGLIFGIISIRNKNKLPKKYLGFYLGMILFILNCILIFGTVFFGGTTPESRILTINYEIKINEDNHLSKIKAVRFHDRSSSSGDTLEKEKKSYKNSKEFDRVQKLFILVDIIDIGGNERSELYCIRSTSTEPTTKWTEWISPDHKVENGFSIFGNEYQPSLKKIYGSSKLRFMVTEESK